MNYRVEVSKELLDRYSEEFVERLVTGDQT